MSYSFEALKNAVIEASEADNWEDAVKEWEVVSCEEDDTLSESCICGQEQLRYLYTIRNLNNENELYPIGSSCINRFGRESMTDDADFLCKLSMLNHMGGQLWRCNWHDLKSYLSRRMIEWLWDSGVFEDTFSDGKETYDMMLDIFNKRNPTYRQTRAFRTVLYYTVLPWYRDNYE